MPTASSTDATARLDATPSTPSAGVFSKGIPSLDFVKIARNPQIRAALLVAFGYLNLLTLLTLLTLFNPHGSMTRSFGKYVS